MGPVLNASEEEMAVSLGTVFVLNSLALLTFPTIGAKLHLTQPQFGLWSALAIHDTSSVVGATAKYGSRALVVGTTVKMARALWIVPLTFVLAGTRRGDAEIRWPWFILFFCVAAAIDTYIPFASPVCARLYRLGRVGLDVTLFLIGSGISRPMLKQVGIRPLVLGSLLWLLVSLGSLSIVGSRIISVL